MKIFHTLGILLSFSFGFPTVASAANTGTVSPNPAQPNATITVTGSLTISSSVSGATVYFWLQQSGTNTVIATNSISAGFLASQPTNVTTSFVIPQNTTAGSYYIATAVYQGSTSLLYVNPFASFTVTTQASNIGTVTPNPAQTNATISVNGSLTISSSVTNATVDFWLQQSGTNTVIAKDSITASFSASQPTNVATTFVIPQNTTAGSYYIAAAVYQGSTSLLYVAPFATLTVQTASSTFSTVCASAVVVGLQWSPVSGATHYTLAKSGAGTLTPSGGINYNYWTDQGVAPSSNYTYTLTALNASGGAVSTQTLVVATPAATPSGDAAYCPTTKIASMTVNWSSGISQANGSDLWGQTLGSDGNEYMFFGDGGGFGSTNNAGRVSWGIGEITSSTPGSLSGAANVYGGFNAEHPATISGKASDILAVGSNFYALGGVSSTTSNQEFGGAADQEIVYSIGNAWTWVDNASQWTFCTTTSASTGFCPNVFLQNGAGYAGNTDGYIYIYGGTQYNFLGTGPYSPEAYLWRVQPSQILSDTAYEAVTGFDANGNPIWTNGSFSTLSSEMVPVYSDHGPSPLAFSAVTYNSQLQLYIATAQAEVNQVAFYVAPNPWGPWSVVPNGYFNSNPNNSGGWGNLGAGITWGTNHGDGLGVAFIPKWTSSSGTTMWVTFSSDGNASTQAYLAPLAGQNMDAFSAVSVTFTLP